MKGLILIVDDRPDDIELTEMALLRLGCDIRTEGVLTGEDAIDFLNCADSLPHMILLDLKMPGMGGLETLRRIRGNDRWRSIPIVIVTASTLETDRDESLREGASGFVHKSIRLDEFSRNLGKYTRCWIEKA